MAETDKKWKVAFHLSNRIPYGTGLYEDVPDATILWTELYKNGATDFDEIQALGADGYEVVSVVPLTGMNGVVKQLLFVLKRDATHDLGEDADTG